MKERMQIVLSELAQTTRSLMRRPVYAVTAIVTLAVGIGGTGAVLTLVRKVLLDPLPYPAHERLVRLMNRVPGVDPDAQWQLASAQYFFYKDNATAIDEIGAYRRNEANVQAPEGPRVAQMAVTTAGTMRILGARAVVGRVLDEADDTPGGPAVTVLSNAFWTRHYGADPETVGRSIVIEGRPYEVIGVAAPGLQLPREPGSVGLAMDMWVPMRLDPAGPFYNNHQLAMIVRLASDVGIEDLQQELDRLLPRMAEAYPRVYRQSFLDRYGFRTVAHPLKEFSTGDIAETLWMLAGAIALVLMIACANVVNLFLVRMENQRRVFALRSALGAGTGAVARLMLLESLVLTGVGGVIGLVLGVWGVGALTALASTTIPNLEGGLLDAGAFVTTAALVIVVGASLTLFAFVQHRGAVNVAASLTGHRPGMAAPKDRVRGALVVAQVALALMLCVSAGLLIASVTRLQRVDPGLEPEGVLAADFHVTGNRYRGTGETWRFYRQVLERVRALPGIEAAGMTQDLPLTGAFGCWVQGFEDQAVHDRLRDAELTACAGLSPTTPGYFEAMGIPIVRGRGFTDGDNDQPERGSVVVSEALAERFWPGESPIGKGVAPGRRSAPYYRVVGVVGDVHRSSLDGEPALAIYYPIEPIPESSQWPVRSMTLLVRTGLADPASVLPAIQREVLALDPSIPLANARTMQSIVDESMNRLTFTALILQVAAGVALVLAAVGLYGVISYLVTRRTQEIGVRIAIGADPRRVLGLVMTRAGSWVAIGMGAGIVASLGLTRLLRGLLFGIEATDPRTFVAAVGVLILVAASAAWWPAWRAARIDPIRALRAD